MGKLMTDFPRADYPSKVPWTPMKFRTDCCGSLIFSARPGLMCVCKCGKSYIDETREYTRASGKMKQIIEEGTDEHN